ncbi:MAG: hypothetical protein GXX89_04170 [Clostridiales bacterium]|nr:hypothetical protein [Clostridiales bacterium]
MCRKNKAISLVMLALGAGLLIATIFPYGFIMFLIGAVLVAAGAILLTRPYC